MITIYVLLFFLKSLLITPFKLAVYEVRHKGGYTEVYNVAVVNERAKVIGGNLFAGNVLVAKKVKAFMVLHVVEL